MASQQRVRLAVAMALIVAGCTNAPAEDAAAGPTTTQVPTTNTDQQSITTRADGTPSSSSSASAPSAPVATTSLTTGQPDAPAIQPETDVFRIAPVGTLPGPVIVYGPDGVRQSFHTPQLAQVVEGPVSSAVDTYLRGTVYQRPGDDRRIFVAGADGDQELLVAAENQTIRLVGIRIEPTEDNTFHVLYVRRTSSTPELTKETLRSYNTETGVVTELLETGGWESGTDFDYIEGERAVGRWFGEAFTRTHIINTVTGEVEQSFPAEGECFDGEFAEGCLPFTVAGLSGNTIYGFGPNPNDSGVVDQMALYRFDTASSELVELISFPWDNGLYYPVDIWVRSGTVVVGLSTTPRPEDGEPLPALLYDINGGEATTAPISGYLRTGFIS